MAFGADDVQSTQFDDLASLGLGLLALFDFADQGIPFLGRDFESRRIFLLELAPGHGLGVAAEHDIGSAADLALDAIAPIPGSTTDSGDTTPLVQPALVDFGGFLITAQPRQSIGITNRGDSILFINQIEAGCDCIAVQKLSDSIEPGEVVSLVVTIDAALLKPGTFSHQVIVGFDHGDPVVFEVRGELVPLETPADPVE